MPLRYPLQNGDFVTDHVLPASHETLADHFARVELASVDVYAFFHDLFDVTI